MNLADIGEDDEFAHSVTASWLILAIDEFPKDARWTVNVWECLQAYSADMKVELGFIDVNTKRIAHKGVDYA